MVYDVLINIRKPDNNFNVCYSYSDIKTYSYIISKFKKEINSIYDFVYVIKRYKDKQNIECITCFKLVNHISYSFSHYPKINYVLNSYLVIRFLEGINDFKK